VSDFYSDIDVSSDVIIFSEESTNSVPNDGIYAKYLKRTFDIVFSILLLPFLVPVIGIIWILAKRDGGAGLFSQERVGLNGNKFVCWKVRTMVPNAERVLKELCDSDATIAEDWHKNQKLENDPRITKIGIFLRSTSLDELPQIWNVIKGDMSLVGPRPFMTSQEQEYRSAGGKAYFKMRPGVTGLWQIEGRGATTFNERVPYDDSYRSNISFLADVALILKTVSVVVRRTGC
jgi:lipopolysaccharide/colanic/teichoic acid biosynthesis glycosyltransferase